MNMSFIFYLSASSLIAGLLLALVSDYLSGKYVKPILGALALAAFISSICLTWLR